MPPIDSMYLNLKCSFPKIILKASEEVPNVLGFLLMISQEWIEFIESGVAILLGCCDENRLAEGARGVGAVVSLDRKSLTIYVQKESALRIIPLLQSTKEVAISIAKPTTYKALQVKGRYISHRETDARDRVVLERYRELFFKDVEKAGIPKGIIQQIASYPALALEIEVRDLFIQTPGPRAGERIL